jgi:tetratricopeptide (TPR) repeat protein
MARKNRSLKKDQANFSPYAWTRRHRYYHYPRWIDKDSLLFDPTSPLPWWPSGGRIILMHPTYAFPTILTSYMTRQANEWHTRGDFYFKHGRYELAVSCYDHALALEKNHDRSWYNKGLALIRLGRHHEAIECFDKVIEIEPNNYAAYNNKGVLFENLGRYEQAVQSFDRATNLSPNNVEAWNNKGLVLHKMKKYKEAIECFDKVIEIEPNQYSAYYYRARAKIHLPSIDNAIEDLRISIEIGGQDIVQAAMKDIDVRGLLDNERIKALLSKL